METNKHLLQHCRASEQGYEDIGLLIYEWMKENRSFKKTCKAILDQGEGGPHPPEYYQASSLNYLLSNIITDAKALKRFQNKHEAVMLPRAKQVVTSMIEHPAYWSFFFVEEKGDDNFFTIVDLLTQQEHQLYSQRLPDLLSDPRIKGKHFLSLVFSNGECLHTAGTLRFNSLTVSDLRFYTALFDDIGDDTLDAETLRTIINDNYIEFFKLDAISFFAIQHDTSQEIKRIWQPFTLEEFDITELGGTWETVEVENQIKYCLLEPDEGMRNLPNGKLLFSESTVMEGELMRDLETGQMWLTAWTDKAYLFYSRLLTRSYPNLKLPKKPSYSLSFPLSMLLMNMEKELPWSPFKEIILALTDTMIEDLFDDEDEDEDVLWQLEEEEAYQVLPNTNPMPHINDGSIIDVWMAEFEEEERVKGQLLAEYTLARNEGVSFNKEDFCLRTGAVPEDVARFVRERDYYTVPPSDKEFEIEGLPLRRSLSLWPFSQSIEESGLFQLDQGPNTLDAFNALTEGHHKDEYFSVGLLGCIEGAFIEFFKERTFAYYVANHFFWILFHKSKDWTPVRSYAIEMLKHMRGIILQKYDEPEAFIADVSLFTKKYLVNQGICIIKGSTEDSEVLHGQYPIKGSEAFFSLVEGVDG
ncbi:MAG: hypothetical protein RBR15_10220 [Sphaerochaeta sp.]|nr:hypothetical protein [Sphaerochaeta sp.]